MVFISESVTNYGVPASTCHPEVSDEIVFCVPFHSKEMAPLCKNGY